jgi:integrase/recombinase XerC
MQNVPIMVLIEEFIQYLRYEKNYSTHTVVAYKCDLSQFLEYVERQFGVTDPTLLDSDMLRSWMVCLLEGGMTARSVNRKLSSLKTFWHYLQRVGTVSANPFKKVVPPKTAKPLPVFLKESEMGDLLDRDLPDVDNFPQVRDRLIIDLFYTTGMRLSELIGLTDETLDLSTCTLKVTGKRDKQRLIPFGPELQCSISQYLKMRNELIERNTDRLLVRNDGKPLYPQMVYRMVHHKLTEVGTLTKNSPHVLRHTFATTLLNRGAELNAVKELLGHSSLSATEVYTHTSFAELKKVYKQAHPRA